MKLILGLMFVAMGLAQNTGQNVVNQTVYNAVVQTAGSQTNNSTVIQNIGQTSHTVKIRFTAITGTVTVTYGYIQGSIDCTNYFNIGPSVTTGTVVNNQFVTMIGYGSYPCLRTSLVLNVTGGGSPTVTFTGVYSGSSAPVFNNVDQYSSNNGIAVAGAGGSSGLVYGTETEIATAASYSASSVFVLYGATVTGSSSMTQLIVGCSSSGTGYDIVLLTATPPFPIVWPSSIRAYGVCPSGDGLYYTATGSGASAISIQYRIE